jgi:23S rRNA pseudouridine2604 synthase
MAFSKRNGRGMKPDSPKKLRGPKPIPNVALFPMRINKYLAQKGYATRRDADSLITKRFVTINGKVAVLGDKVNQTDVVEVRNNKKPTDYMYYVYNKPEGVQTDKIDAPPELYPITGLDREAEGVVIFSNDRRLVQRLYSPEHPHTSEFLIRTKNDLRPNFKEKIEQGVVIHGQKPIESEVFIKNERTFVLRTTDTGVHIRQMCSMFFAEVDSLVRTKVLNITLKDLQAGQNREITGEELAEFLQHLGL